MHNRYPRSGDHRKEGTKSQSSDEGAFQPQAQTPQLEIQKRQPAVGSATGFFAQVSPLPLILERLPTEQKSTISSELRGSVELGLNFGGQVTLELMDDDDDRLIIVPPQNEVFTRSKHRKSWHFYASINRRRSWDALPTQNSRGIGVNSNLVGCATPGCWKTYLTLRVRSDNQAEPSSSTDGCGAPNKLTGRSSNRLRNLSNFEDRCKNEPRTYAQCDCKCRTKVECDLFIHRSVNQGDVDDTRWNRCNAALQCIGTRYGIFQNAKMCVPFQPPLSCFQSSFKRTREPLKYSPIHKLRG